VLNGVNHRHAEKPAQQQGKRRQGKQPVLVADADADAEKRQRTNAHGNPGEKAPVRTHMDGVNRGDGIDK